MKFHLASRPLYVKLICILLTLVVTGYLAIEGKKILSPVVFACLFSILLLPLCRLMEKKLHFSRNLAAAISVVLMLLFVGGVIYFLGAQLSKLAGDWPVFKSQLVTAAHDLQDWVAQKFNVDAARQVDYVHKATSKVLDSGTVVAGATLYSVSSAMLFISFTVVYSFFFLLYRGLIRNFFVRIFSGDGGALVQEIMEEVQSIIRKYITGMLIEMTIISTFVSIVFTLVGIKYAILLGLITGLLNIIPYIGMLTAMVVSALVTFAGTVATGKVIWIIAILFGTHVIDYNILLPVIVGSKVKINAMVTLTGIIIGEMIWGIAGMFLSIPIIAVVKIIFDRVEPLKPWGYLLGDDSSGKAAKPGKQKTASLEEKEV